MLMCSLKSIEGYSLWLTGYTYTVLFISSGRGMEERGHSGAMAIQVRGRGLGVMVRRRLGSYSHLKVFVPLVDEVADFLKSQWRSTSPSL